MIGWFLSLAEEEMVTMGDKGDNTSGKKKPVKHGWTEGEVLGSKDKDWGGDFKILWVDNNGNVQRTHLGRK